MKVLISVLVCLALLSVANTKRPKPGKPGKAAKPSKPGKPAKPSKPGKQVKPSKSGNEMFDQKAFEDMPGCLPCLKKDAMYDCITTCYDSSKDYAPEKCLVCLLDSVCLAPCGIVETFVFCI